MVKKKKKNVFLILPIKNIKMNLLKVKQNAKIIKLKTSEYLYCD